MGVAVEVPAAEKADTMGVGCPLIAWMLKMAAGRCDKEEAKDQGDVGLRWKVGFLRLQRAYEKIQVL